MLTAEPGQKQRMRKVSWLLNMILTTAQGSQFFFVERGLLRSLDWFLGNLLQRSRHRWVKIT